MRRRQFLKVFGFVLTAPIAVLSTLRNRPFQDPELPLNTGHPYDTGESKPLTHECSCESLKKALESANMGDTVFISGSKVSIQRGA